MNSQAPHVFFDQMNDLTMIIFFLQPGGCPTPDSSSETFAKRLLSVIPAKAGIHNKMNYPAASYGVSSISYVSILSQQAVGIKNTGFPFTRE